MPLCLPQIPHGLLWVRTLTSSVRSRRLTVWAVLAVTKSDFRSCSTIVQRCNTIVQRCNTDSGTQTDSVELKVLRLKKINSAWLCAMTALKVRPRFYCVALQTYTTCFRCYLFYFVDIYLYYKMFILLRNIFEELIRIVNCPRIMTSHVRFYFNLLRFTGVARAENVPYHHVEFNNEQDINCNRYFVFVKKRITLKFTAQQCHRGIVWRTNARGMGTSHGTSNFVTVSVLQVRSVLLRNKELLSAPVHNDHGDSVLGIISLHSRALLVNSMYDYSAC